MITADSALRRADEVCWTADGFDGCTQPPEEISGGGIWYWAEYHRVMRERARRRQREIEEEIRDIEEEQAREIARLLREQEARDVQREELKRLQRLADRITPAHAAYELSDKLVKSMQRASVRRTISALLQLQRELAQAIEEEDAMIAALLIAS